MPTPHNDNTASCYHTQERELSTATESDLCIKKSNLQMELVILPDYPTSTVHRVQLGKHDQ